MKRISLFLIASLWMLASCSEQTSMSPLPELPPIPEIPEPLPQGSVKMTPLSEFPEEQLDIPIADGPFQPSWESIEAHYPGIPQWLRDAKVGIWVCFGPQSAGESGDWYARHLYMDDNSRGAYQNHLRLFGHPSEVGYKDVLRTWKPDKLDPARLTKLYKKAGARFLMIMGVHHDNFDLWDSWYQPWNSKNIGPERDLLGEWSKACHKAGMRFGVTFHHEYTWWWWQSAFGCDSNGPKAGVPYDGHLTLEDGKGKWWEGYDPRRLYTIDLREYQTVGTAQLLPEPGVFGRHLDYARWYATQWALRMMDVTSRYDPDFIYTDGTDQGPFSGSGTGAGYRCNAMPIVMADFYNRTLKKRGRVDSFSIVKFRRPTNGTVNTAEFGFPDNIDTTQTWIRETPVGDWYYKPGFVYDAGSMERFIIESVCRDGCVALNIPICPDGSLEAACEDMLEEVGRWMEVNGQGIYGSRAWQIPAEGIADESGCPRKFPAGALGQKQKDFPFTPQDIRFTQGKDGKLYAFCMKSPEPGQTVSIRSLGRREGRMGEIRRVRMLGAKGDLKWQRTDEALEITCPEEIPFQTAVTFQIE